jgi:hypothetical protein
MGSKIVRRGQSTFEYALLIGITAAGIILMLIYISRGHQGNLRSQADQLGARQYAPGQTTIVSDDDKPTEAKQLSSLASAGSQTKTEHPVGEDGKSRDVNEPTTDRDALMVKVEAKMAEIYSLMNDMEIIFQTEGPDEAAWARKNGLPWPGGRLGQLASTLKKKQIEDAGKALDDINALIEAFDKERESRPRKPDKTTTTSYSSEKGKIKTEKNTNETLGAW